MGSFENASHEETSNEVTGFLFDLEDCIQLFKRLKKDEINLNDKELNIFQRLEKILYSKLSIREIEDL